MGVKEDLGTVGLGMLFSVPVCAVLFSFYLEFMKKASTNH